MRTSLICILFALASAPAVAQTNTGTVSGIVLDSSGAVVANAPVELVNTATSLNRTTKAGQDGAYQFTLVQPGPYRLAVEAPGFKRAVQEFQLEVDQTARIDVTLTVGAVSESVTVGASSVLLESETSALGQVISTKQVADLPLNGRNPFALAALSPGVVSGGSFGVGLGTTRAAAQAAGANNFMADGGIAGSNELLIDGVPVMVCCQGQPAIIPSVDVTSEFKVQTNSSSSEFGRTSGGILNIITKSGSNDFHGSAYEFFENDQLNAANFFTNRSGKPPIPGRSDFRAPLRYNLGGFTVGGPVWIPKLYTGKNKTFFFGGWEGTYVRQYSYQTSVVPPATIRGGNLTEAPGLIYDPATTVPNPSSPGTYIRTAFPGNIIPANRINPIATNYLKYFPQPSIAGVVNNYNWVQPLSTNDGQGSVRVDHNINEASRLFARYSLLSDTYTAGDWPNGITGNGQIINSWTFAADYVNSITPSAVLDVHYGFAYQRNQVLPFSVGTNSTSLGFPAAFQAEQLVNGVPLLNIGSYRSIGNDSLRNWVHYSHALGASLSWVHHGHNIRAGWDGRLLIDNQLSYDGGAGSFSFTSGFTAGPNPLAGVAGALAPYDSFASFLLGDPSSGSMTYSASFARYQPYNAFFLQDDWHVTPKFTLNLGVRYDIDGGFVERYNRQSWFDPSLPTPLAQQTGLPITGALGFSGVNGQPHALWATTNAVAPRVGFAWQVIPKTVIRGAYGIFFLPTSERGYGVTTNAGFQVSTAFVSSIDGVTPIGSLSNPYPNGTTPITGSSLGALTLVGQGVSGFTPHTPLPYNQQWNIGVQRELPGQFLLNVAYAGSHSVKLPIGYNPNALQYQYFGTPGSQAQVSYLTALVPNPFYGIIQTGTLAAATVQRQALLAQFPQFTSVGETIDVGSSFYNSLQVSVQKRYSHGLTLLLAYTRSKNLGDVNNNTTGFLDAIGTPGYQTNYNRRLERSVLATDIPQRLVIDGNYELPFGKGKHFGANMNPWLNAIAGGWQLNGIGSLQSGTPLAFSVTGAPAFAGSRPSFTGPAENALTSGSVANRLGGVSGGPGYFNASDFSIPVAFQLGNVPRLTGNIRGPAYANLDFSMVKFFPIRERLRLQFRLEAFNALNQVVFGLPNTSVGSTAFGTIASQANSPRILQVALKLLW